MQPMISAEQKQTFETEGVVCLRDVFEPRWIELLQTATDIAMENPGPNAEEYTASDRPGRAFNDLDLARRHAGFADFMRNSPAARIAAETLGSNKINFFYDQLIVKEPNTSERTPWHQDQPYWGVSGRQIASVWLPMDPVSADVSVQYVAGSHLWGSHNPHHFADDSPYTGTGLPELPDIEANRDKYTIRSFNMQPGDCIVFHGLTVHGAPGNASGQNRRRALATRWAGDDARYLVREGEIGVPTRDPGIMHGDILDCEDFPVIWRNEYT